MPSEVCCAERRSKGSELTIKPGTLAATPPHR
ncbi:hypothetical protein VCHC39A1_0997, partial [Vibrio cholerae HC-39A1]